MNFFPSRNDRSGPRVNILILTNAYLPDIGGVEWSVARLARAYAARGHLVRIMTEWKEHFDASVPEEEESGGVRVIRMRIAKRRPITRILIWNWLRLHVRLIREADVVHFFDHGTLLHWYLPFRFLFPKKRYILTHCGFDSWPIRWKHRLQRRIADRMAHARIHVGSYIAGAYRSTCEYQYIGAPVHEGADPLPAPEKGVFAFLGRLEPDTGFDRSLDALLRLAQRREAPVTLIVCGDGSLRGSFSAAESGGVRIVDFGTTPFVREACARAEIIFASSYLAIFDAMAMDRIVVAFAANELKEKYIDGIPGIREAAFVARQARELDEALEEATSCEEARERKRRAARGLIASLSWDRIAEDHLAIYVREAGNAR